MKSGALLPRNAECHRPIIFITEPRSKVDDTRQITRQQCTAFHFYFYSKNDPTSPKGPEKRNEN